MEQFIFLLVIIVISLIKWLMEKSAEQRAKRQTTERMDRPDRAAPAPPIRAPRPIAQPLPDFDSAARRLREALGLPDESELPPARRPVAPPPPLPTFKVEEVKVVPRIDLEHRIVPPPAAVERAAQSFRQHSKEPILVSAPARSGIAELLASRDGLRKAILAQEILGTPKGLVF
jgi:hypothetical protein